VHYGLESVFGGILLIDNVNAIQTKP